MRTDNSREAMTNAISWAKKDLKELQKIWSYTQRKQKLVLPSV